jgi:hypothetical protein
MYTWDHIDPSKFDMTEEKMHWNEMDIDILKQKIIEKHEASIFRDTMIAFVERGSVLWKDKKHPGSKNRSAK